MTAVLAIGVVVLKPDVHSQNIAVLAKATTISLSLIVNSVVIPTSIGIHANDVMDWVNIQPEQGQ
jgi:hypothetical protein